MKILKSLFAFYIESSIHVSIAVVAFTIVTLFEFDLPIQLHLVGFVFFGTVTGYNFIKYAGIAGLHHRSLAKNLKIIQVFSFISFGFLMYFIFNVPKLVLVSSFLLGILTLFYVVPFLNKKNLRSFSGLKVFIVATVWAGVTVIIPWLSFENTFNFDVLLSFIQRFFLVLVLIIPFEIRDLKYDVPTLGTFPQRFGIKKAKSFGYIFLILILILQGFKDEISLFFSISLIVVLLIAGVFIKISKVNQSNYFAAFWVEAIPIYWVGLLIL